jgi:hypothetical protein
MYLLSIKGENIVAAEFYFFHRQGEGYICVLYWAGDRLKIQRPYV